MPARGHEAVPERRALPHARSAPSKSATSSPGSMAKTARPSWSAMACSCAKSRRPAASTACSKPSSATTSRRPPSPKASPAKTCSSTLERRLDSVIYRMGFGTSRAQSRQIVRHGHIQVNGRKVNIPSFMVKIGDEVAVRENKQEQPHHPVGPRRHRARARLRAGWMWTGMRSKARITGLPKRDELVQIQIERAAHCGVVFEVSRRRHWCLPAGARPAL